MKKNKYVDIFIREAEEHLEALRKGILALEKDGVSEAQLNELLRSTHTLKGSANMVDLVELAGVAHRMEDLLKDLQNDEQEFSSDLVDVLLVATDAIEALMAQAQSSGDISVNVDTVVKALETGSISEDQAGAEAAKDYQGVGAADFGAGKCGAPRPAGQPHGRDPSQSEGNGGPAETNVRRAAADG